ncbi:TonB-dependent receptor [Pseudomonas aeruginosa]|uniref:Probable TonB-dependent receptor n=1 Tax=Pseudomonas aeruginosa (strain ATCC 15692 / DSM 22644 / CIP 104116 / JCM 14847 / LMG 12228 / 1C / PRS 101 / PAO1) TaxID=208964 RepID=Q9I6U2_PSEAE|nr:TonB-dependent receptor [Pseudomonas aeruginosa]NP_248882.1 TonB-dependent receptor [Pseudomonas aeruginosa PAO1]AAG03582.1 probable TonB-dependent receptor [Pseudomonas aeruginosa PAO1]AGV62232.1 tonB dependent receptor family protein [Pseudomonas aeruginosa PAO581]AGY67595.1 tonB dependent receptor family protein [Pseudomonas aeruginosa PAO1-VE2]AGY71387.1 tonB dependent receptor family protein [Pseudomonas aeruginosa PAO1-VE13]AOP55725.1 TonB-dependent receptor [Pseudomonas aeruginosa]
MKHHYRLPLRRTPPGGSDYALALLLALGGALPASAADAPAPAEEAPPLAGSAPAKADTALGKVTVTARRREEDSQKVPTPITVLGGETLEAQRISRVQDLQQVLPSVNVAYIHARQSSVAVRGIGNNPASDGLEGSAGIYLDNVYLGRPGMAVFDLLDIEQLELLRGPQGTLFGKNTTAGVLNISTRAPTFTAERTVEVSGGQDGYFQGRGTVSGPLGETLAGRLSAYRTRDDGYIKNIHDDNYLNGGERQGARGQLLFEPNEDFSLRWIADYNEEDSSNGSMVVYGGAERFWQRAALVGASPLRDPQRRKVNINGRQHVSVHQGGSSLEANWNLAGGYRLTSISAYRYWHFTPANDEQLNVSAINDTGVEVHDRQFSQEIRLASPTGGAFDYVVGAYAFRQNLGNKTFTSYGPLADLYLLGANLGALNDTYSKANGKIETDSFALFAQGTWHLTERLDFTAGLRGTYEEKNAKVERFAPLGGAAVGGVGAAVRNGQLGAYDSGDLSQYNFAPSALLSLSYQFSDDLLGYASLSHGEKSGGVNLAVGSAPSAGADSLLVGPERANDAELGLKSTLFDRRLLLNANLFWTGIHGYQATTLYQAPGSTQLVQVLANAGSVRSRGLEFEATALPLRGLTLNFNGSYNDVTYLSFKDAPCPAEVSTRPGAPSSCDLTGQRVVGASKWIANLNGEYQWRLDDRFQPYVSASYAYRSAAEGTLDNSDLSKIDGYALVNLAAGLRSDLGDGQLDTSVWLKNAFDKDYYLSAFASINGSYTASVGQPRTLGVSLRYDF